jgi:hypothetical protein
MSSEHHRDDGKPDMHHFPDSLWEVGLIMEASSRGKYKDVGDQSNWWYYGDQWQPKQLIGSAIRHCMKYCAGQWLDEESERPHLAHAICNLMMLLELCLSKRPDLRRIR